MAFLDSDTMARMKESMGLSEDTPLETEDDTQMEASNEDPKTTDSVDGDPKAEEKNVSSDDSTETVEPKADDVKESPKEGWIPYSRFTDKITELKAAQTELQELRQFKEQHGQQTSPSQRTAASAEEKAEAELEALKQEIWGDNPPEEIDHQLMDYLGDIRKDVTGMKAEKQEAIIADLQEGWKKDIADIQEVFAKEHGITDPALAEILWNGIAASQGQKHAHEIAEQFLQATQGMTRAEAKEVVKDVAEDAEKREDVIASPRGAPGKRGPSKATKKRKEFKTMAEASAAAAASMGIER